MANPDAAAPGRENTAPGRENTAPSRENTAPSRENTAPSRENTAPSRENEAARPSYEAAYHTSKHALLIRSPLYYDLRAREAEKDFFSELGEGAEVFEFGLGLGQNVARLKSKSGYDISAFARTFAERRGIAVFSDLSQVPDARFDVVLSSHVLEHLENPLQNLQLLRSKLKPGGSLVLVLPVEKHRKVPFAIDDNQHLYSWNFRTINNLLQRAGYVIQENRYRYAAARYKLRHLGWLSFALYHFQIRLLGRVFNRRDMVIVARPADVLDEAP